jgi:hypothetical protein
MGAPCEPGWVMFMTFITVGFWLAAAQGHVSGRKYVIEIRNLPFLSKLHFGLHLHDSRNAMIST